MMKTKSSLILALLAVALFAGCAQLMPRTDSQIAAEVQNKINADQSLPNKQITIRADKGVITLSGAVGSDAERTAAAADAAAISGVKTVVNNLTVGSTVADAAPVAPVAPAPAMTPAPAAPRVRRVASSAPVLHRAPQPARSYESPAPAPAPVAVAPAAPAPSYAPVAAAPAPVPAVEPITVQEGTVFSIRLTDRIDTNVNHAGDVFRGTLDSPIMIGDKVAIPQDADVTGRITEARQQGHYTGSSQLALELTQVSYNGKTYQIRTDQYTRQTGSRTKGTVGKVGGGAAIGAVLGGIIGGGKGAAIGAASGAGVGGAAQTIQKPEPIVLPSETQLSFRLENSVTVAPSNSSRADRRFER